MSTPAARAPIPPTALIGREGEIARVRELLAGSRLVSLTGPGGTGKTRLALAVLQELEGAYRDGVAFVDLAPLADPALVLSAIAGALGVQETAGRPLEDSLQAFLARRELLLCLDNFEHLLDGATVVSRLLAAAPALAVLATSRAPLRLAGEHDHRVPPLESAEALALFAVRAGQTKDGFVLAGDARAAVEEICERVDRLPLAIELAAARVRALPPEKLLERLGHVLPLLTQAPRDAPARQQTLRATIEWSYGLLSEHEQVLLARLSVFTGGCSLEAAEAVCDADLDTLTSLVEQSLLREEDVGGEPRYSMLETVREYALDRLEERAEEGACRRLHAAYFLELAEVAEPGLEGRDQVELADRLERELDNIRAVLGWAVEVGEAETAQRLGTALWNFWETRRPREGRHWLEEALALGGDVPPTVRARTLLAVGDLTYFQGNFAPARGLLQEGASLFRKLEDDEGLALTLGCLLWLIQESGDHDAVPALAAEVEQLLPRLGTPWVRARALSFLGVARAHSGDRDRGLAFLEESRRIWQELGNRHGSADAVNNIGWEAMLAGDYTRAQALQEENLSIAREAKDMFRVTLALGNLGLLAALVEDFAHVGVILRENLPLLSELGGLRSAVEALVVAATRAAASGEPLVAARITGAAEGLWEEMGGAWDATQSLLLDRHVWPERSRLGAAFEEALADGRALSVDEAIAYALESLEEPPAPAPAPPALPPFELVPGAVLGGFEVEELVGRGGMGVVYRARQRSLDRAVALKVLSPALAEDELYRARFLREARLAAAIEHPNVLPVYEAGQEGGHLFLAVRYVRGEDLGSLLERERRLGPERAVRLVGQIAAALDAAHDWGLVHRDVKPSNVLVERRGEVEHASLTDFGVARATERATGKLTQSGQLLGTVDYLAPELIEGDEGGPLSDVYALGCVLFELLTGQVPFERDSQLAALWAHVSDEPPSLAALDPALPSALDLVVRRGLAKSPEERFTRAGELAHAASVALQRGAALAPPRSAQPPEWPKDCRVPRRR